ncbi:MAG: hypothetical protein RLY30_484 [Pseudomonadota bacterium]
MTAGTTPYRALSGSCLCGDATYTVDDGFEYALNCHCGQCRRSTGSAFKAFGGIARERLKLGQTAPLMRFGPPDQNHDVRCANCGSLLFSVVRGGAYLHVTLGTLMDTPTLKPTAHIFVGSKADWFEIRDDLPQHTEF